MEDNLILVEKDSPFIEALVGATEFRRSMVEQGHFSKNGADILSGNGSSGFKVIRKTNVLLYIAFRLNS
jgi:hypothetical protein